MPEHKRIALLIDCDNVSSQSINGAAMIIDAMDLLYCGNIDAFTLMSSDSDFTPLAVRIRENGLPVYGFWEKKTPLKKPNKS